jgi:hypothetical protein
MKWIRGTLFDIALDISDIFTFLCYYISEAGAEVALVNIPKSQETL